MNTASLLLLFVLSVTSESLWHRFWGQKHPSEDFKTDFDVFSKSLMQKFDTLSTDIWQAPVLESVPKGRLAQKLDKLSSDIWSSLGSFPMENMEKSDKKPKVFLQSSVRKDDISMDYIYRNGKDHLDITAPDFSKVDDLEVLNEMRKSVGLKPVKKIGADTVILHIEKPTISKYLTKSDCQDGYCMTYVFSNGKEQLRLMGEIPESFDRQKTIQTYRDYFGLSPDEIKPAIADTKEKDKIEEKPKEEKSKEEKPKEEKPKEEKLESETAVGEKVASRKEENKKET